MVETMSDRHTIFLNVQGMKCEGCATAVKRVILRADPNALVTVALDDAQVVVRTRASSENLIAAITAGGYPTHLV